MSLNASDLCKNCLSCLTNNCFQLLVENTELLLCLCLNKADLLFSVSLNALNLCKNCNLSILCGILKQLVEYAELLLCLSIENCNLLFRLECKKNYISIGIFAGIYNCKEKKVCDIICSNCKRLNHLKHIVIALSIKLTCVVNKSTYSLNGSLCILNGSRQRYSNFLASDQVIVLSQPSFSFADSKLSHIEILVDLFDHSLFYCLVIGNSISLVIVLLEQRNNLQKV